MLCLLHHPISKNGRHLNISSTCKTVVSCMDMWGSMCFAVMLNLTLMARVMCLHNKNAMNPWSRAFRDPFSISYDLE